MKRARIWVGALVLGAALVGGHAFAGQGLHDVDAVELDSANIDNAKALKKRCDAMRATGLNLASTMVAHAKTKPKRPERSSYPRGEVGNAQYDRAMRDYNAAHAAWQVKKSDLLNQADAFRSSLRKLKRQVRPATRDKTLPPAVRAALSKAFNGVRAAYKRLGKARKILMTA